MPMLRGDVVGTSTATSTDATAAARSTAKVVAPSVSRQDVKIVEGVLNRIIMKVERDALAQDRKDEQTRAREVKECMEDMVRSLVAQSMFC